MGYQTNNNHHSHELYSNMKWSERLQLIHYRVKIIIDNMTAAEINNFHGNSTLTVSFTENGIETVKIINARREKNK
ncbi:GbNV_gp83-like [Fopius arisanus]|nr:GbNV_gp83-like [Fopius arisanus]